MIPKDIESGEQWQVRYEGLSGNEVTQTGNEGQMRFVAKARKEWNAILERRTVTVSAWEVVDPEAAPEEDDEADG